MSVIEKIPTDPEVTNEVPAIPARNVESITTHDADLLIASSPEGWRAAWTARLPEAGFDAAAWENALLYPSRAEAIVAACEEIVAWCGEQKLAGGKRHQKAAQALQDWALALERKEAPAVEEAVLTFSGLTAESITAGIVNDLSLYTSATPVGVQMIEIGLLHESSWNPRQYYPEAGMAELTESMRASGFREWLPLMVRPVEGGGYEIGAGHRRRRAAEAAGIRFVPCIVREMTDEQFLDVLNFDNSGREDVHPLHEAAGWREWMKRTGKGVVDIAVRIGQSKEYVYQRLKYAKLIDAARAAFLDGRLTARHAVLIARLEPKQQEQALEACTPPYWKSDRVLSCRELQDWIARNLHNSLDDAIFPLDSAELRPEAGPCTTCPHRQGNAADFNPAEDLPNVCTRVECYDEKTSLFREEQARVRRAMQVFEPVEPVAAVAPAPPDAPKKAKPSKEDKAKEQERQRAAEEARLAEEAEYTRKREEERKQIDAEKATRIRILRAILGKVKWPPRREEIADLLGDADLPGELEEFLIEQGFDSNERGFAAVEKLPDQKLAALLVLVYVSGDFDEWRFSHGCERLNAAARRYGVDPLKVRAEAEGGTRKEVIKKLPSLSTPAPKKANKAAPAKKIAKKAPVKKSAKKGGKK